MRKCLIAILILVTMLMTYVYPVLGVSYFYDGEYHEYVGNIFKLEVDGKLLNPVMPPIVFEDYSVVPARAVFEEGLGATVTWDGDKQKVTVKLGNDILIMTINSRMAGLNTRWVTMPIAPKIIDGYTMVPARFVAEQLGMNVKFDSQTDTIKIDRKKPTPTPKPTPTVKPSTTPAVSGAVVTGVSTKQEEEKLSIVLQTDQTKPDYSSFVLESPTRIVVDVVGSFKKLPSEIKVDKGNLIAVRFGQNEGARVVVDVSENLGYSVKTDGKKLVIEVVVDPEAQAAIEDVFKKITYGYEGGRDYIKFNDLERGTARKQNGKIIVPVYGKLPQESDEEKVTGHFSSKMTYTPVSEEEGTITIMLKSGDVDMYETGTEIRLKSVHKALPRSVMLDAGHGGPDAGAVAYNEDGSIKAKEKDFNLDVTLRAEKLLKAAGVEVHLLRSEDVYVDFQRVGSIANDAGVSLFVSIHTNSFTSDQAHGIETFGYLDAGTVSNGMTSERLSELLLEELIDKTDAYSRGVKDGRSLAVINSTKMPASLIEIGFITNEEECNKMMQESYRQKLAQAVCDAVLRAFDEMDI